MKIISQEKINNLRPTVNEQGIIAALAIDQRGALKKMMNQYRPATTQDIIDFKKSVSTELTPFATSILLDPEYGLPAAEVRDKSCGLLLAYEKTGYDAATPGRLPDSLDTWSVKCLKEAGANVCKFLLYYDADEPAEINEQKKAYIERIGSECEAEGLPFFLEILTYDAGISDNASEAFARLKPYKVIAGMEEFSKARYNVDVLKVEVPVNMNYVEGFGNADIVYTQGEARAWFKRQDEATMLPYIFLSAGVTSQLFQATLEFAKQSGSQFNGVLCGRATWAGAVQPFIVEGANAAEAWLRNQGKSNISSLNEVLNRTASPIWKKISCS
jgi:tagatose 1,6-diphosphate aldolase